MLGCLSGHGYFMQGALGCVSIEGFALGTLKKLQKDTPDPCLLQFTIFSDTNGIVSFKNQLKKQRDLMDSLTPMASLTTQLSRVKKALYCTRFLVLTFLYTTVCLEIKQIETNTYVIPPGIGFDHLFSIRILFGQTIHNQYFSIGNCLPFRLFQAIKSF